MATILLIAIVVCGLLSLIFLKGDNIKERLLFSGFLILICSIIYSVSFLGFKVGGSNVYIAKEVERGKKEIEETKDKEVDKETALLEKLIEGKEKTAEEKADEKKKKEMDSQLSRAVDVLKGIVIYSGK